MDDSLHLENNIKISFPAQICFLEKEVIKQCYNAEVKILYESGASIVIFNNDINLLNENFILRIFLPPCYSPDHKNSMILEIESIFENIVHTFPNKSYKYNIKFKNLDIKEKKIIKKIISLQQESVFGKKKQMENKKPEIIIRREVHSCHMYSIDLSIGCSHKCIYCHFSENFVRQAKKKYPDIKSYPVPIDIEPLYSINKFPESVIYLSPASDPFSSESKDMTYEILSYLLPKGIIFAISTKAVVDERTLKLLNKYSKQIESIAIGITSFDNTRNKIIEPFCPDSLDRLENAKNLLKTNCPVYVRIDPIFPEIDDNLDSLNDVISKIHKAKIKNITASYLFSFGRNLQKMKKIKYLQNSINQMTEKSYQMGGKAYSADINKKRKIYNYIYEICRKYSITFNTCGCKEVRLQNEKYSLVCRNMNFYNSKR